MEILHPSSLDKPLRQPRPRRRLSATPPNAADPMPWLVAMGEPALHPDDLGLLQHLAERRHVAAGDTVLDSRDAARTLVLLVSGDVVLGSRAHDGAMRTERSLSGPAWLDASSAWLDERHEMDALALSDVVIAEVPIDTVRAELASHPDLAQRFCAHLARRVHELTEASRNLLHHDAPARLARWLLQRCPPEVVQCELRLQERKLDIAQQLAMTPETLSRLMRSFETRGVIGVRGYVLSVHDVAALRGIAGDD
ncbi:MAG: Crp/Fnr family transcriptional regulator [Leptothrix sp. (in: b-proteobacteria)]